MYIIRHTHTQRARLRGMEEREAEKDVDNYIFIHPNELNVNVLIECGTSLIFYTYEMCTFLLEGCTYVKTS